jgi:hypothetical protein
VGDGETHSRRLREEIFKSKEEYPFASCTAEFWLEWKATRELGLLHRLIIEDFRVLDEQLFADISLGQFWVWFLCAWADPNRSRKTRFPRIEFKRKPRAKGRIKEICYLESYFIDVSTKIEKERMRRKVKMRPNVAYFLDPLWESLGELPLKGYTDLLYKFLGRDGRDALFHQILKSASKEPNVKFKASLKYLQLIPHSEPYQVLSAATTAEHTHILQDIVGT